MFFATIYLIMNIYQSRHSLLPGSSLGELSKLARHEYHIIQKRTPRRVPYVRSTYFTKDKIFVNSLWDHTNKKSPQERVRRLKLYKCALDTLRNTPFAPNTIHTNSDSDSSAHQFYGISRDGIKFCVRVKENKRTGRKDFTSVYPVKD